MQGASENRQQGSGSKRLRIRLKEQQAKGA